MESRAKTCFLGWRAQIHVVQPAPKRFRIVVGAPVAGEFSERIALLVEERHDEVERLIGKVRRFRILLRKVNAAPKTLGARLSVAQHRRADIDGVNLRPWKRLCVGQRAVPHGTSHVENFVRTEVWPVFLDPFDDGEAHVFVVGAH